LFSSSFLFRSSLRAGFDGGLQGGFLLRLVLGEDLVKLFHSLFLNTDILGVEDLDVDLAVDEAMQVNLDAEGAEPLDRLEQADLLLLQLDSQILLDGVGHVLAGHGAEEASEFAGLGLNADGLAVQLFG